MRDIGSKIILYDNLLRTYCLSGCHHEAAADAGQAAEGAMQAEIIDQARGRAAAEQAPDADDVDAPRTEHTHQPCDHHATDEHSKEMPILGPGHEDVAQADQIELHDERAKGVCVVELQALSHRVVGLAMGDQHIALIVRDGRVLGAAIGARIAPVLLVGVQLGSCEYDEGHEPGSRQLAQKDDQHGAQLPDAKVTQHMRDDVSCSRLWPLLLLLLLSILLTGVYITQAGMHLWRGRGTALFPLGLRGTVALVHAHMCRIE